MLMKLAIDRDDRILVVAPHPDDETLGCGGLLALYGTQCDVLVMTDGRYGRSPERKTIPDEEMISIRYGEIEKALAIAKVNRLYKLDIEDGHLDRNRKKAIKAKDFKSYGELPVLEKPA